MNSRYVRASRYFLLGFSALFLSIGFNNCGGFRADPSEEVGLLSSAGLSSRADGCYFNGLAYQEGASVTAYLTSTVSGAQSCASETRTCRSGSMTGSYAYASCGRDALAACLFNGQTIASGQGVTAYTVSSVPTGQSCLPYAQFRGCTNGVLSGSATYASCQASQAASCLFNGQTVASGQGVTAFTTSSVPMGGSCASYAQFRTCNNGALSGTAAYASCQVTAAASCLFNGQTIASGQGVTAYTTSSVPYGGACSSYAQFRTCNNGVLSGSAIYASCQVAAAASCLFNGQTVPSGGSVVAYQESSAPRGGSCASQTRTCSNGTLSGSYTATSCSVGRCDSFVRADLNYLFYAQGAASANVPENECRSFCQNTGMTGACIFNTSLSSGDRCGILIMGPNQIIRTPNSGAAALISICY